MADELYKAVTFGKFLLRFEADVNLNEGMKYLQENAAALKKMTKVLSLFEPRGRGAGAHMERGGGGTLPSCAPRQGSLLAGCAQCGCVGQNVTIGVAGAAVACEDDRPAIKVCGMSNCKGRTSLDCFRGARQFLGAQRAQG